LCWSYYFYVINAFIGNLIIIVASCIAIKWWLCISVITINNSPKLQCLLFVYSLLHYLFDHGRWYNSFSADTAVAIDSVLVGNSCSPARLCPSDGLDRRFCLLLLKFWLLWLPPTSFLIPRPSLWNQSLLVILQNFYPISHPQPPMLNGVCHLSRYIQWCLSTVSVLLKVIPSLLQL